MTAPAELVAEWRARVAHWQAHPEERRAILVQRRARLRQGRVRLRLATFEGVSAHCKSGTHWACLGRAGHGGNGSARCLCSVCNHPERTRRK